MTLPRQPVECHRRGDGSLLAVRLAMREMAGADGPARVVTAIAAPAGMTLPDGAAGEAAGQPEAMTWSEARLHRFLDAIPAPIWSALPDGRLDYANRTLFAYTGETPESLDPADWASLVHPEDRDRVLALVETALRAGEAFTCELRLRAADGSYRWHLDSGAPMRDTAGGIVKFYGTVTDMHDIKRAEDDLRDREARLRAILESEPECVKLVSAEGRLIEMNPAGLRMIEADSLAQVVGLPLADLVHPDDRPAFAAQQRRALAGETGQLIFRAIGLKGGKLWLESHATPLKARDGTIEAVLSVTRDITVPRRQAALQALETRVLDMLSGGAPLPAVLGEITGSVDRLLPDVRSSILLIDGEGRLRHGAAPGLPAAYCRAIEGQPIGPRAGSCGTAAHRGEPVIVTDIDTDPLWDDYRDLARPHGLRACWSTPVLDAAGRVLATFAIYHAERRAPGPDERQVTERIGQFVRTAIERHSAMEALKASEERLRSLTEHIQEVFWMTDQKKRRMLYISPAYETIWGRSCAELYADPEQWLKAVHEEDRPAVAAAAARQDEGVYTKEYRIVRPDGAVRWISDRGFPVRDEDGAVRHIVGTARDITPRKLVEFALRERLKELHCLYRVLSLLSDQARPVEAICGEIADALPHGLLHQEIAVAEIQLGEARHRSAGWAPPEAVLTVPIRQGGTEAGRVSVGYLAAREPQPDGDGPFLREEADMIGAVAAHIGQMLHNRRIAAQLAHSERLNAIGQLGGGVAHDFNNLLTVILGNAEALALGLSGDRKLRSLAELTMRAAERGAELTGRLLAFARRQPLEPQATDVNQLVAGIQQLLRHSLAAHVEIEIRPAEGLWPAMIDPAQLEDALVNLCLNARDAMPGGGRLTIEMANTMLAAGDPELVGEALPGAYVTVAVRDTGIGMDGATLQRAFEPFFTTKEVGTGSGLGLSMVYGFAAQSRGQVRIVSAPGEGCAVILYLPRAAEQPAAEPALQQRAVQPGGERVLLVEDDDMVRDHVTAQLQQLGYDVTAANGGAEALELLASAMRPFDLLFTDVVMPGGLSGPQLAARARALCPGLPVLFTSGHTEEALAGSGDDAAEAQLLRKPYRRHELAAALRRALGPAGSLQGIKGDRSLD